LNQIGNWAKNQLETATLWRHFPHKQIKKKFFPLSPPPPWGGKKVFFFKIL